MKIQKFKKTYRVINENEVIIKLLSDRIKKLEKENFVLKNENRQLFKILNNVRKDKNYE